MSVRRAVGVVIGMAVGRREGFVCRWIVVEDARR